MANLKISQLTTYTGTSADLRWFVMNNATESETFKFSGYTSPLKESDGLDSFVNVYDTSSDTAGDNQSIVGGFNNTILETGPRVSIFGGYDNTITNKGKGYGSVIVGGGGNTINGPTDGTGNFGGSIFGSTTCENNGYFGSIVGAIRAYIGVTNNHSNIVGGDTNQILNDNSHSFIGGGLSNTIQVSCQKSIILGGRNNTINNQFGIIAGGGQNTAGYISAVLAGFNNNAQNQTTIIGGETNTASGAYGGVFGGTGNAVSSGAYSAIYNSQNSTINSSGTRNALLSTNNSTITGSQQNAVMIGTSGRTATTDYATFVENLVIFNYSALNFADDTAAAAGGVVLGQVYHNAGALRIRIV
jgi:hypothetical protein